MKMLISLGFLFVSILHAGVFVTPPAWGNDLKTVFEKKYANAGFIASDLVPVGTIIQLSEQRLTTSGPDEIFVDIGKRQGIKKGDRFTVYSLDRYIYHPVLQVGGMFARAEKYTRRTGYPSREIMSNPGKPVGHRVVIQGVIEIIESGDKVSSARAVKSYDSIETGHLLTPYKKFEDQTAAFPETDKSIEGYIVASKGDRIGLKDDDIVYIDKGWEDNVRSGDYFEVYTIPTLEKNIWYKLEPEKTPLLPFVQGEIKIIDTQKKTATAIVVKSRTDIVIGNPIRFKHSHHPG
ncbi:MAG: hypothetical protein H8E42_02060 [Nitrospinae bacterium]|nr:hypothetical protein [Nitrospinota bacterium]MBL7019686.1 hypothetical protein [Nitrospinaceae bacterium]